MNGYETDEMETISELLEGLEFDESDELGERRRGGRRGRFGPVPAPSGRSSYQPQSSTDVYVKKSELARAIMNVDTKIKTNTEAITKVNTRVNAVADLQATQATALKNESAKREKDIKELRQTSQFLALLPLITRPTTRTITQKTNGLQANDKVPIDSDGLTSLLPLLLVGGLGNGSSGSLGLGGGGDSSTLLILALALGGGLGGRR